MVSQLFSYLFLIGLAVTVVALTSTILLFYFSTFYSSSDVVVERMLLTTSQSVIVLRGTGNIGIERVLEAKLSCESSEYLIDPSAFRPQPVPAGGSSIAVLSLPLRAGEFCRLHARVQSKLGEVVPVMSEAVAVISQP